MKTGWAVLLGVLVSCTPAPAPVKPARPHPFFPIDPGDTHSVQPCVACHALTNTNFSQFECISCHEHAQETVDPIHLKVAGYRYASEACYSCHPSRPRAFDPTQSVRVTALVPTWSGTTIVSVTPTDEALPMRMNHGGSLPDGARDSCANCHVNAALAEFYPGQLHGSLQTLGLAQPTVCAGCHAESIPVGFSGALGKGPFREPASGEMKHDAVAWASGAPTTTTVLPADCGSCHAAPSTDAGATWKTAARGGFHQASQLQPSSCLDCHANARPLSDAGLTGLRPTVRINHATPVWQGDCVSCHRPDFDSGMPRWAVGGFHRDGGAPLSCLPCHAIARPQYDDAGVKAPDGGVRVPFDFGTNAQGITHGSGQDCAVCHRPTGAVIPVPAHWTAGDFRHGPGTASASTCVACHSTQRPAVADGLRCDAGAFDHALSGDCFGCHRDTSEFAKMGDWSCGLRYPAGNLISSTNRPILVTQIALGRSNGLVIGTTSTTATLYNAMLHTSGAIPSDAGIAPGVLGNATTCWHCHTSTPGTTSVVTFVDGKFHAALDSYRSAPNALVTPLAQPTALCADCHSNMRPLDIVQADAGTLSVLQPMDHGVASLSATDCASCHRGGAGVTWSGGVLHPAAGPLGDCTGCHYTLMADGPKVDVISGASTIPDSRMKHRSAQVTFQSCDRCHGTALSKALGVPDAGAWKGGAFHSNLTTQPGACVDCHAGVTTPTMATQSALNGQWMNHAVALVTSKDCAFCHAAPTGTGWSKSTRLHVAGISPTACQSCHGAANGGAGNNVPPGLVDSTATASVSAGTGRAGLHDQISHADGNVTARDCNFCHTAPGQSWVQANFHARFTGGTALVGQCSNCHANLKPVSSFSPNHAAFGDCSSCHGWPGTGGAAAPNWHRASVASAPPTISVGGFIIAQPPSPNATTTQAGVNNLAHPAVSGACTNCHASNSGGRGAFGYDHTLAPATGCASCHEAGSDLVGTPWTLNAPGALAVAAQCGMGGGAVADRGGDTRPVGITSLACSSAAASLTCGSQNCVLNHFFPSDCGECHLKPTAVPATVQTGAEFVSRWKFQHSFGAPAQQSTCCHCHGPPSCRP